QHAILMQPAHFLRLALHDRLSNAHLSVTRDDDVPFVAHAQNRRVADFGARLDALVKPVERHVDKPLSNDSRSHECTAALSPGSHDRAFPVSTSGPPHCQAYALRNSDAAHAALFPRSDPQPPIAAAGSSRRCAWSVCRREDL